MGKIYINNIDFKFLHSWAMKIHLYAKNPNHMYDLEIEQFLWDFIQIKCKENKEGLTIFEIEEFLSNMEHKNYFYDKDNEELIYVDPLSDLEQMKKLAQKIDFKNSININVSCEQTFKKLQNYYNQYNQYLEEEDN